jgi:hypothetical protein
MPITIVRFFWVAHVPMSWPHGFEHFSRYQRFKSVILFIEAQLRLTQLILIVLNADEWI